MNSGHRQAQGAVGGLRALLRYENRDVPIISGKLKGVRHSSSLELTCFAWLANWAKGFLKLRRDIFS
jgi:hypothetical protein